MSKFTNHQEGTISWVDLGSSDAEVARSFYAAVLGWEYDISGPEFGYYANAKTADGQVAGIGPKMPGDESPSFWSAYFCSYDSEATCARAKTLGGTVLVEPMQVGEQGKMSILRDPAGAVFGVWQPINHKGVAVKMEPGALRWTESYSRDAAGAVKFYSALFGLKEKPVPGSGGYHMLATQEGEDVAGVMQMDENFPDGIPSYWQVYFQVENTDAAVDRARAQGAQVYTEPFNTGYSRVAVVADPTGASFSMFGPEA
jgi:uncharacterized protein